MSSSTETRCFDGHGSKEPGNAENLTTLPKEFKSPPKTRQYPRHLPWRCDLYLPFNIYGCYILSRLGNAAMFYRCAQRSSFGPDRPRTTAHWHLGPNLGPTTFPSDTDTNNTVSSTQVSRLSRPDLVLVTVTTAYQTAPIMTPVLDQLARPSSDLAPWCSRQRLNPY